MTTVRPATDINAVVAKSDNPTAGKFSVYYYDANPSDGDDDANDGNNAVDDDRPTDRWVGRCIATLSHTYDLPATQTSLPFPPAFINVLLTPAQPFSVQPWLLRVIPPLSSLPLSTVTRTLTHMETARLLWPRARFWDLTTTRCLMQIEVTTASS